MKTYEVKLLNGTTITVTGITSIWSDNNGVYFETEKDTAAYVPHNNLASYQLAENEQLAKMKAQLEEAAKEWINAL